MTLSSNHAMRPRGSHFADADAARRAIAMTLPMIESAMQDREVCGSGFLCIVVMDPGLTPRDADFSGAVLVEHAVGNRTQWDADYAGFARAKARLSWTHRMGSHEVQASRTHVLRRGDSVLWGECVARRDRGWGERSTPLVRRSVCHCCRGQPQGNRQEPARQGVRAGSLGGRQSHRVARGIARSYRRECARFGAGLGARASATKVLQMLQPG